MTDQELNDLDRLMAEKVMGWKEYVWSDGYGGVPSWQDKEGIHRGFVKCNDYPNPWCPTRSIEQAMMAAEKIGLHIELVRYEDGKWKCTINDLSEQTRLIMSSLVHAPALAICLAAQAWVRGKK